MGTINYTTEAPHMIFLDKDQVVSQIITAGGHYPTIDAMESIIAFAKKYIAKHKTNSVILSLNQIISEQQRIEHERMNAPQPKDKMPKPMKITNIYLIRDKSAGLYKIGMADNVKRRFKAILSSNPTAELICHYPGLAYDETELHKMFAGSRVSGEWFKLDTTQLQDFVEYFELPF